MSEEIRYMGSTKKEIWDAYKELKEELATAKIEEPVSTTERAKKNALLNAITIAGKINTDGVMETLKVLMEKIINSKNQYNELVTAIEAKKDELKEVHDIEISANDLAALAVVKGKLIADKKEEAEKIIADALNSKEEADKYYTETLAKAKIEANAITEEKLKERKREEEQYSYDTARKRRIEEDKINDELLIKSKSLDKREAEVTEREALANEKDKIIEELTLMIENLEKSLDEKINKAFGEGEEKAKRAAQFQANMVKVATDAEVKIAQATIINLQEKITNLEKQVEEADRKAFNASEQVAAMAQSALRAQADVATISEVSKIATGAQKK